MNNCSQSPNRFARSLVALAITGAVASSALAEEAPLNTEQSVDEIIVVSGSRSEDQLEDVAGAVSVVTAEDIDMQVSNSLSDLFRYHPSISSTGRQGQAQTLSIRGIGGNRVVYIKDGRRLNDAYAGGGGYLVGRGYLDTAQVQQVEVAKAAASPLYGSDGLGGVIVISTPDPDDLLQGEESHLTLSAGYDGLASERKLGATVAKQFADSNAMLQVSAREGQETQNYEESLPGYDYDSQSILAKWAFAIADNDQLKFTVDHFQQTNEQVLSAPDQTTDDDRQSALSIDYQRQQANAVADQQHWQLYFSDYQQSSDQVASGAGQTGPYVDYNDYDFEQTIIGIRWQAQKAIAAASLKHELVYGLDVDYYDTHRPRFKTRVAMDGSILQDNEPQKAFPGAETWLSGLFLQDDMYFDDIPFKLIAGARLDHYQMSPQQSDLYDMSLLSDIDETAISPKVAGVYTFANQVRGYLQYAEGFKIPPHDQAYQNHGVEPFYAILPNPDLKPENSRSLEAGFKFSNDSSRWEVAAYYSQYDDFIETEVVGSSPTYIPGVQRVEYQYVNKDNVTIKGLEASFSHWLDDNFRVDSAVAYVTGEDEESEQPLTSLSPLSGNLSVGYFTDMGYVRGIINAVASMQDVPTNADQTELLMETGGYATIDLLAGITLADWQINIAAQNLTDKYYIPYQNVAGLAADTPTEQYSQPGRSFSLQAQYQF